MDGSGLETREGAGNPPRGLGGDHDSRETERLSIFLMAEILIVPPAHSRATSARRDPSRPGTRRGPSTRQAPEVREGRVHNEGLYRKKS